MKNYSCIIFLKVISNSKVGVIMINNRGLTVRDRITESFDIAREMKGSERKTFAIRAIGVADFALEFGLISYEEWEKYLSEYLLLE